MSGVFCESNVKSHESTCTWTINDWKTTEGWSSDMKLRSKIFSSATNDGTKWYLEIYPMGHSQKMQRRGFTSYEDYVSIDFCLASVKNKSPVRAKFNLYGLNRNDEEVILFTMDPQTICISKNPRIVMISALKRELLTAKYGVVLNNKLKLVCRIIEYTDIIDDLSTPRIIVPERQNADDYSVLFETKALSDIKIIAKGNIEFEAHKVILAVHSPVFAAMFKHDTTEQRKNSIEIIDTDPKVLEKLLRFIYTGKVGDIDEMATDLLVAADKYDLQRLKIMCEEKLFATLNVENAADIFTIADRHSCKQLKTLTGRFISEHIKDVIRTEAYILMIKSYPPFAEEFLHEMFS